MVQGHALPIADFTSANLSHSQTMPKIKTIELTLPNHYATPLIYGDTSGLEEEEEENFTQFWANELHGLNCVDVKDDSCFVHYHDASPYCLPTDCSTFVFITNAN